MLVAGVSQHICKASFFVEVSDFSDKISVFLKNYQALVKEGPEEIVLFSPSSENVKIKLCAIISVIKVDVWMNW